jgi:hypothetical protein
MLLKKPLRTALCSVILGACPFAVAVAGLGGDATSVEADRVSLKGAVRVTPEANFAVHEITGNGLVVHEYLSDGKVFAVSWMLGSYYGQFAQAASAPHYNHHHLDVATPQVIVQSSGHTRAFFGRAWVPALLPANFAIDQIN